MTYILFLITFFTFSIVSILIFGHSANDTVPIDENSTSPSNGMAQISAQLEQLWELQVDSYKIPKIPKFYRENPAAWFVIDV